ncbi:MAG: hypothetical protein EXS35_05275 [Pedosphaera sp.]|nr:hypothetical protein [Pedosphaera sp.]
MKLVNQMKKSIKKAVATATGTAARKPAAKSQNTTTTIEARIDVGFGNSLFVRGQGAGLSWERGTPLTCVDGRVWRLTVPAKEAVQFKLLLNDSVWAQGNDLVAAPGQRVEVTPAF